jgi:hypothetical protein
MTVSVAPDADPTAIKQLANAFCAAKLLLSATELGLFTTLDTTTLTTAEVADALGLHPRGVKDFLDALVGLGLLSRTDGRYANTPATSTYLVRGKDTYSGGFLERANRMLYPAWGKLTDALRTGRPQAAAYTAAVTTDPARLNQFLAMMDSVNGLLLPDILAAFDWTKVATVADVGGARGNLAGRLAQANPQLRGTVFDLPEITEAANAHLHNLGVSDRISFSGGDFFTDELPRADVIIYGHVLHNWSPAERAGLVKKAYEALPPGGALLIYDAMLDDDRGDLSQLLVSLNMLLVTEGGSEYTVQECTGYLTDAGFTGVIGTRVGNNNTLVIGHRPA